MLHAQNLVEEKNKFKYQLEMRFKRVEEFERRRIYRDDAGVTFGYEIGRKIQTESDIEKIMVLTAVTLSESSQGFSLIHQDYPVLINDKNYGMLIYSVETDNGQEIYNCILFTTVDLNLISFSFACPLEMAEKELVTLQNIMESIEYVSN